MGPGKEGRMEGRVGVRDKGEGDKERQRKSKAEKEDRNKLG